MTPGFWMAFGASLVAASVTAVGIHTIRHFEAWGRRHSIDFVSFAAGVLISVSFMHIVPRSFAMSGTAPAWLLTGYLSLHLLNRLMTAFVCERDPESGVGIGLIPLIGIGLHSFIDGIIYSVTFSVSAFTGALAALGMVLHEFPEGIITYMLLIRGGLSRRRALTMSIVAASVSTPLGTLVSYPLIQAIDPSLLGALLSLSAGALIYVGATHLLPQTGNDPGRRGLVAMGAGILLAVLIVLSG